MTISTKSATETHGAGTGSLAFTPIPPAASRSSPVRDLLWWFYTLLICAHFTITFGGENSYMPLAEYVQGRSPAPYGYRVLPIAIMRALLAIPGFTRLAAHAVPSRTDPLWYAELVMVFAAMVGAVLATRATLRHLTGSDRFSRWACLLVLPMSYANLTPVWGLSYSTPYDVLSLGLFSLGVYLIVTGRLALFYPVFLLATLTRETSCFLTVFLAVWLWTRRAGTPGRALAVVAHVGTQAAIWVALKVALWQRFRSNGLRPGEHGPVTLNMLGHNLHTLAKPAQWPVLLSACAFLLPVLWANRHWIGNRAFARSLAVVVPLWLVGMLVVGVLEEVRIFNELTAFVAVGIGLILFHRFGLRDRVRDRSEVLT